MYCANVARTYVIDPSKEQEAQYKALLDAQAAAIAALREGAPLSAAHEAATAALQVQRRGSSGQQAHGGMLRRLGGLKMQPMSVRPVADTLHRHQSRGLKPQAPAS